MPYPRIHADRIQVLPLSQRKNYIDITLPATVGGAIDPDSLPPDPGPAGPILDALVHTMRSARDRYASRILTYGAHTIKNGCGLLLNRLIEQGWLTHLATQGAGIIHDWEFAFHGKSSESVRDNAPLGRFGTWDETGENILGAAMIGVARDRGLGESMGHHIQHHPERHPYRKYSVAWAAYRHRVPLCVMPGIGQDIFACHPMYTPDAGAALGQAATIDFHTFTHGVMNLTHGVYLSVGSSVMSPQVFEKAFSIANNLRQSEGAPFLADHHVAVVDLQPSGGWDWSSDREPPPHHPAYYLRWCKTFSRLTAVHPTQKTRGTFSYIQADNRIVLHNLVHRLAG
jgi:hypothetical protein